MSLDLAVRWADNTADLKSHLKEGLDQIVATTAAADKMAQALGGDRLMQASNNYVAALSRMGAADGALGAIDQLTNAERDRGIALLEKSAEKYAALGSTAPSAMTAVLNAMKAANTETDQFAHALDELKPSAANAGEAFSHLKGTLGELFENPQAGATKLALELAGPLTAGLGAVGIAGGAVAAVLATAGAASVELVEKAASLGGKFNDLNNETGMSVTSLSRLSNASIVAGTDVSQITNAVFLLEKQIGNDGPKVAKGLDLIGLSLDDIKKMSPDQMFETITTSLAGTEDATLRNAAGADIFGKQYRDLAPLVMKLNDALAITAGITPFTDAEAKASEQFEMQVRALRLEVDQLEISAGRELLPTMKDIVTVLPDVATRFAKGADDGILFDVVLKGLTDQADAASNAFNLLFRQRPPLPTLPSVGGVAVGGDDSGESASARRTRLAAEARDKALAPANLVRDLPVAAPIALPLTDQAAATRQLDEEIAKHIALVKQQGIEAAKTAQMWADYNSVGASVYQTLLLMDGAVVVGIANDLQRGVSIDLITKAWGVNKDQIEAVRKEEAFLASVTDDTNKGLNDLRITIPDLSGRTAAFRDELDNLSSTFNQFDGGVSIAGDELDHVVIPAFTTLANVKPSTAVEDGLKNDTKAAVSLSGVLSSLSSDFGKLAADGTGAFSLIFKGASEAVTGISQIEKAAKELQTVQAAVAASGTGATPAQIGAEVAGYATIATAVYSLANAYIDAAIAEGKLQTLNEIADFTAHAFDSVEKFSSSLNDSIVTLRVNLLDLSQIDLAKLGVDISGSGKAYYETLGVVSEVVASALKLPDIIKELGGLGNLTATQMATVTDRVQYLFRLVALGGTLGTQATQSLDTVLADMANTAVASGQPVSDFFLNMAAAARTAGIQLTQVTAFFEGQAANMASGLNDLLTEPMIAADAAIGDSVATTKKALDDLLASGTATGAQLLDAQQAATQALDDQHQAATRNQQALADLGVEAVGAFDAAVAAGDNFLTALGKVHTALQTIQKAYADVGLAITDDTLKGLVLEDTILHGTAAAPSSLGTAIGGLQAGVTAGINLGPSVETSAQFTAQQHTLDSLYVQAQAASANAGTTGDAGTAAALEPFQALLHQLDDFAKKNGTELDASTEEKITASKDLGIWNDDYKTDSEKTRDSMTDLITSNDALAQAMAGMPAALATVIAGRVPAPNPGTSDPGRVGPEGGPTVPQAEGGSGYASGPMTFTTQGNEYWAFSGENKTWPDMTAMSPAVSSVSGVAAAGPMSATAPFRSVVAADTGAVDLRAVVDQLASIQDSIRRQKGDTFQFSVSSLTAADYQAVTEQEVFPAMIAQLRRGRGLTDLNDVLGR